MEALEGHLRRQIEHSRNFFWHRLRWRAVASYLPKDEAFTLVDVGAGAGLLGLYLRQDRPLATYRFVEPLDPLERHLEQQFGADANTRHLPDYREAAYIAMLDVLEHQEHDSTFLEEVGSKMASGAKLIVTVPALPSLWSQWDVDLGHFRRYDKETLRAAVRDLPFSIVELSYLFPEMVPLGWIRKLRRPQRVDASPSNESALFPDLPRPINSLLHAGGALTVTWRRWSPRGTSLLAVLQKS